MPEPNRSPWQIQPGLGGWPFWSLVEQRVTVILECEACHHEARWTPAEIDRRSRKVRSKNFGWIARKLRCSKCRSEWVKVSLAPGCHLAK